MSEIRPGRKYTFEEMAEFRKDPAMTGWAAKGYVWEQGLDGTLELVHWKKSILDNEVENPRLYVDERSTEEVFPTEPIEKRTPQERKDSLINRWWDACRKAGTVPGLSDEQLTNLFGREWKTGVSEITYADIERMASAMLNEAENKAK
jgi:hypothetical protein